MIKKSSTAIFGFLAFGIYFILLGILIFYFNIHNENKSKHYVKKNENRIQVALSAPQKATQPKTVKKNVQPKKKPEPKPKPEPKAKPEPKPEPKKKPEPKPKPKAKPEPKKPIKKIIKEKAVKKVVKKKDENLTEPKKINKPKNLFANISPSKKVEKPKLKLKLTDKPVEPKKSNLIEISDKPSASSLVSNSLKIQQQMDSGVEDDYLAKVQSMLEGWPAQNEYAGEKIKVLLLISPSGFFEFKLKTASSNPNFNAGLTEYLEQLQEIGFGHHKGERTYRFEAEFIAKE